MCAHRLGCASTASSGPEWRGHRTPEAVNAHWIASAEHRSRHRPTLAEMSSPSSSPHIDFDALYRGESPGEGLPPVHTPPWDTKAPKENVVAWHNAGWVHGDVLDI